MYINKLKTVVEKMRKKTLITYFSQYGQIFCIAPNLNLARDIKPYIILLCHTL